MRLHIMPTTCAPPFLRGVSAISVIGRSPLSGAPSRRMRSLEFHLLRQGWPLCHAASGRALAYGAPWAALALRLALGAALRLRSRSRWSPGLKRAVAQGVKLGRPKIDSATERKVRNQLAKGVGILKVARSLGIGTGTVQRIAGERAMSL